MTSRNVYLALALSLAACGSKNKVGITTNDLAGVIDTDAGTNDDSGAGPKDFATSTPIDSSVPPPTDPNQVAIVVDNGPSGAGGSANVGFVSVKICAPGTQTCATIDHISVDTGSVGLRIVDSVIPANVLSALPITTDKGNSITECYIYADGYVFGTVRTADFTLGSETVAAMPFHVIGDKSVSNGAVPSTCSQNGGTDESTVQTFGGNGIIGVAPFAPDCEGCTGTNQGNPFYFGCTGGACSVVGVPQAKQLSNPVSLFDTDNNGLAIALPDPGNSPKKTLSGTITFGIGTQSNNALPSGLANFPIGTGQDFLNVPASAVDGKTCTQGSFFDTGTNFTYFGDKNLTACTGGFQGFYCPSNDTDVPCSHTDGNGTKQAFNYTVGNAMDVFGNSSNDDTVFKTLVGDGGGGSSSAGTCIWGMPFHYGKKVYLGIEGTTVDGATTPFEAY